MHLRDCDKNNNKLRKVHRIVAEAFIPKIEGKDNIDHINGIRDDNRVENLRWCTTKENANYPLSIKNKSESIRNSYIKYPELRKIRSRDIGYLNSIKVRVFKNGCFLGIFNSIIDVSKEFNLPYNPLYQKFIKGVEYKGYKLERV